MSERERYPAGVPCWVDTLQPDPQAALDFYGPLFGWEFAGPGPMPGESGHYFVAQLKGRDVAGIGSLPAHGGADAPAWNTYVRVDSPDETARAAKNAGGSLLNGPFDALPAGRLAVIADPAGAEICRARPEARRKSHRAAARAAAVQKCNSRRPVRRGFLSQPVDRTLAQGAPG